MKGVTTIKQLRIDDELKKDTYLKIRINKRELKAFQKACSEVGKTQSQVLRDYIFNYIQKGGDKE